MKGRWIVVGISAAALIPVLALLLLVLWMGFWQNGPGEPIVYTLNHYRNIFSSWIQILKFSCIKIEIFVIKL